MSLIKTFFKKTPLPIISFCTLVAVAALNYQIIHNPIVFIATFVLFIHELGHYLIAKSRGAKVKFPYFIPLPFIAIGITQVTNLADKDIPAVALAGPLFAVITVCLLILFNLIYKYTSTISLVFIALSEIVFNYFGSDGSKYRKYNRINKQCTI